MRVFGPPVVDFLTKVVAAEDLMLSGVVARPVYACMGDVPGGMCMSMASMSRIFKTGANRGMYLCNHCAWKAESTPVSDSAPLRALQLYAIVDVPGVTWTVLRMKPVLAVVNRPPEKWCWGTPVTENPKDTAAVPEWKTSRHGNHWRYNNADSDYIWCSSNPYSSSALALAATEARELRSSNDWVDTVGCLLLTRPPRKRTTDVHPSLSARFGASANGRPRSTPRP